MRAVWQIGDSRCDWRSRNSPSRFSSMSSMSSQILLRMVHPRLSRALVHPGSTAAAPEAIPTLRLARKMSATPVPPAASVSRKTRTNSTHRSVSRPQAVRACASRSASLSHETCPPGAACPTEEQRLLEPFFPDDDNALRRLIAVEPLLIAGRITSHPADWAIAVRIWPSAERPIAVTSIWRHIAGAIRDHGIPILPLDPQSTSEEIQCQPLLLAYWHQYISADEPGIADAIAAAYSSSCPS